MSSTPNFTGTPVVDRALITTADTSRVTPTNGGTAFFAPPGALGGMCERITVFPNASIASKTVARIFHYDGAIAMLKAEIPLPVMTISLTDAVTPIVLSAVDYPQLFPMLVEPNASLRATVNDVQASGVIIVGEGGGF